jgi:glucokinase
VLEDAGPVIAQVRDSFGGARVIDVVGDELLEHVAMTIVDLAAVLDPQRVIFDGSIGRALGPYLARLSDLIAPSVLYVPELVLSTLMPSAPLAGAVAEARAVSDRTAGGR